MASSISRPAGEWAAALEHQHSGSRFAVEGGAGDMLQVVERQGLAAAHDVEYVIGSGNAALGFLISVGDYVCQSPIAYYTQRARWGMAPGYELHPSPDFDRPVLHECLWCHAGRPRPVGGTQNRYLDPPLEAEAITCDRCHGDPRQHLAAPSARTIVNPAALPAAERDSVCEQCHLGGEERVLNPGRGFGDFVPGLLLEQAFTVFVSDFGAESAGRFKVVSHVEQLALSRCHSESAGRMWCGTCHSPHEKPSDSQAHYRSRCLGCHAGSLGERHARPGADCVSCHMVAKPSFDSGHSAFTDHRIARFPQEGSGDGAEAAGLRAWRRPSDPRLAQRNLGLAYIRLGRRQGRTDFMDEGASLLASLAQRGSLDAVGMEALGSTLLSKDAPAEAGLRALASELIEAASAAEPGRAAFHRSAAASLWQAGDLGRAIARLDAAIALDPQNRAAYEVLARIHQENDGPPAAIEAWWRYLRLVPQSLRARQAVSELRALSEGSDRSGGADREPE